MKILFLTDNFPPEVNAPSSRTFDHCKEWVRQGAKVTVITCAPNFPQGKVYPGYRNKLYQKEWMEGIEVIRVWSYIVPNKGFFKRTLDYISYSISAFLAGLFVKCDVIIATSPQFFTALAGRALSRWKRRDWIMEVRDLWPESIKTVGAMKESIFIRYFEWQEMRCYRSARRIVVVTDSFKTSLIRRGISADKIDVVKNGVNKALFTPRDKDRALLTELGLEHKTIIGYIGTHGMAHKLDFILRCAKRLEQEQPNIHFMLLGGGAMKEELVRLRDELQCHNVTMLDPVPKEQVARYISIQDISLINLKKSPLFTTVIPSKIFENAGMAIPILMGVEGEAKEIVQSYGAGICFEPENEEDFCQALQHITQPHVYKACQQGGIRLAKDFDRERLAGKMMESIRKAMDL